ncbi:MAG: Uma2 family endonuclease [Spirosomataceae bacterium]
MEITSFDSIEEYKSEDIKSLNHSRLINRICIALDKYDNQYDVLPELELELEGKKVKPDLSIYANLQFDWLNDIIFFDKAPLTVIEILSPKQAFTDLTDKVYKIYLPQGVQSVWIVLPPIKHIYIFTKDEQLTFTQGVLKDPTNHIETPLEEVFK